MKTIEISDETFEYLQEWLYGEGSCAWYCDGVSLDMKDYDGAIKSMANAILWRDALLNESIPYERVFEDDIKRKEK